MSYIGHVREREILSAQIARGTLPQVIALVGPAGTGKEHLGRWLAQAVLCTPQSPTAAADDAPFDLFGAPAAPVATAPLSAPCQQCSSCRQFAKVPLISA